MANEFNIKITNTDDIKNLVGDIVAGKADPIGSAETLDRLKKVEEAALTQKKDSIDRNELGKISRSIYDFRDSIEENTKQHKGLAKDFGKFGATIDATARALGNAFKSVSGSIISAADSHAKAIADYTKSINTRLDGSIFGPNAYSVLTSMADYTTNVFYKTEDYVSNVNALVDKGIAYNVAQRAFLMTVSDSVATTFNVANGTLLRLIRLQSEDSTAARMGMEVVLNQYLNATYQTTEYLSEISDQVGQTLFEAQSLMGTGASAEFEYTVQKWLGSLYSVGMSSDTLENLAAALNQLGSGDITSLLSSSMGNLIAMGLSRAGLSYSSILSGGLDATTTNTLLASIVSYMQEIAENNSIVAMNQMAKAFGLRMSDLQAATNPNLYLGDIYDTAVAGYQDFENALAARIGSIGQRLSTPEALENLTSNLQWTIANALIEKPGAYLFSKIVSPIVSDLGGLLEGIPLVGGFLNIGAQAASVLPAILPIVSKFANLSDSGFLSLASEGGVTSIFENLALASGLTANTASGAYTGLEIGTSSNFSQQFNVAASTAQTAQGQTINAIQDMASEVVGVLGNLSSKADSLIDLVTDILGKLGVNTSGLREYFF